VARNPELLLLAPTNREEVVVSGFNQAILLGRLVASPEELTTKAGKLYAKATIAVSVHQRSADGASEERTSFIPVVIFGRQAEVFSKYVAKGDMVHLVGRLDSSEWKTQDGEKRLSLSFIVEQLNLLPNAHVVKPRPSAETQTRAPATNTRTAPAKSSTERQRPMPGIDENGDPTDLPF
jgi:single-strand DNA-binding protein